MSNVPSPAPGSPSPDEVGAPCFVPPEVLERVAQLSDEALDALPFGVVGLDEAGRVIRYNRFESELAQVPRAAATGADFFAELAPCTGNALVRGRFEAGVARGALDTCFPFTFSYRMTPTPVRLHLYRCPRSGTYWLFVEPEPGFPTATPVPYRRL